MSKYDFSTDLLYGEASNGSIKQWQAHTSGDEVIIQHGQRGGKITEKRTTSKPKNVGRANATTGAEQAILEATSKVKRQWDKDYRETVEQIPRSTLPNLASKYQDKRHTLDFDKGVSLLVKLDGVRCTMFMKDSAVFFQSRGGKAYPVIQEIAEEVNRAFLQDREGIFVDGELYCHGMCLEDITSAVKKHKHETQHIQFAVFDYIDIAHPKTRWIERNACVKVASSAYELKRVWAINAVQVHDHEDIQELHDHYVGMGYEGVVLRPHEGVNSFGNRTTDFIKYKVRKDAEFRVIRIDQDKNGCALPWCEIEVDGVMKEFKAPMVGTQDSLRDVYEYRDLYIDLWLKVEFEAYSKYGIPAKPKGILFRQCDENGDPLE